MKSRSLLLLMFALLAASCSTKTITTTKKMDIYGAGVIQYPVVAELDVKVTKVTGTARSTSGQSLSVTRNNAVADALKNSNADVLIEPIFESETTQGVTRVTVTGFPGTYINFRHATKDDVDLLNLGILQKATVSEPESVEVSSKGTVGPGAIVGALAGASLILYLLLTVL